LFSIIVLSYTSILLVSQLLTQSEDVKYYVTRRVFNKNV